ncbi:hypothetical protein [Indiicoccus explosivorum]|uniref:hypothetical protein n=1 Tax=Indiicoccus explosivorum TaxID=1917864 RepID=UPI000B43CDA5|nr:hypothetical protein [Indiicoccus explosivorum]
MSRISSMTNRLLIEQDYNVICISNGSDGGLVIEEHCLTRDTEDGASLFVFSEKEKQALLEYLITDALSPAKSSGRLLQQVQR